MPKLLSLAFAILFASFAPAIADRRVALVIGNGTYLNIDKLANPLTDSRAVHSALGKLGFEIVYGENLAKRELERAIGKFAISAKDADVALVYYAGHGATFGDTPYLVPVDAHFTSLEEMPYELVPVEAMVGELRRAKGLRIAILDACRDNAAERSLKQTTARGGEISRGLAPPKNPDGMIIAYATQYLSTAADGDPSGDSPFTAALLQYLPTPGMDVKTMFFKVGQEVITKTKGAQRPEIKVSFFEDYALAGEVKAAIGGTQQAIVVAPPPVLRPQEPAAKPPRPSVAVDCKAEVNFECIKNKEIPGLAASSLSGISCRIEQIFRSDERKLNWKNIWTTSLYSFAPGGGGPGGGLQNENLEVGGWGDWYYSLIQFDMPTRSASVEFSALLLYAKPDKLRPTTMYLDGIEETWGWKANDRLWWKDKPKTIQIADEILPAPERGKWYFIDITNIYRTWLSNPANNHGIQLRPVTNDSHTTIFGSSLTDDPGQRPRLLVCS